jgi:putative thioredoxin
MGEGEPAWSFDVREADFSAKVLEASRRQPVVVDFWAPWCGPCRFLGPLLEEAVAARKGEVLLAKVDIDQAPGLADAFGISSIPAVKAFRDGRLVREFVGLLSEAQVNAFLDGLGPSPADRLVRQAREQEAADPAAAERLYRQALADERTNEDARLGLAQLLLRQGKADEVAELLEPLGSEGERGALADRLKAEAFLRGRARAFGDEAAARARLAAEPDNARRRYELGCVLAAEGKYAGALPELLAAAERDPRLAASDVRPVMVQIFYALGAQHPLANEYRNKLAGLLY